MRGLRGLRWEEKRVCATGVAERGDGGGLDRDGRGENAAGHARAWQKGFAWLGLAAVLLAEQFAFGGDSRGAWWRITAITGGVLAMGRWR